MNILFLGPQGSGKGTQAKRLSDTLGFSYLEVGEMLRNLAKTDPRIDEIINTKGKLLPDEEVFGYVKKYITQNQNPKGIVFDGFPRSIKQYELLKSYLSENGEKIDRTFYLDISKDESVKRLSSRRVCKKCGLVWNLITNPPPGGKCSCTGELYTREDDTPAAIEERLRLYKQVTDPLIKILGSERKLVKVNGERPIDVIFEEILDEVKKYE